MADILSTVTAVVDLATRIKRLLNTSRDIESKTMIADLLLQLAHLKVELAAVLEEKEALRTRLSALENPQADFCPKCRRRSWQVQESKPDHIFGDLGASRRVYLCSECGFTESRLVH